MSRIKQFWVAVLSASLLMTASLNAAPQSG